MIDLEAHGAVRLRGLPLALTHVRDLEYFDRVLLAEYRSATGDTYLFSWCDRDETATRWLVVRVHRSKVLRFLVGLDSLRELLFLNPDGFAFVVDIGSEHEVGSAWLVIGANVPIQYRPVSDIRRPRGGAVESGFQDVCVNEHWDHEKVAEYPRRYLQAYAFQSAFGPDGDAGSLWMHLNLTKGWVFHTLYEAVRARSSPGRRAALEAVTLSSPGYLRFKVDDAIAGSLREAVLAYMHGGEQFDARLAMLRDWSNGKGALAEADARGIVLEVCAGVGLAGEEVLRRSSRTVIAAKALSSYFRRLDYLAKGEDARSAILVGLQPSG